MRSGRGYATAVIAAFLVAALWAGSAFAADWAPNKSYSVGTKVTFSGIMFQCRQAHTSQTGWEPPNVRALWMRPTPVGVSWWAVQTNYPVNSEVVHKGLPYKCLQPHVADAPNWSPDQTPALWARTCNTGDETSNGNCVGSKVASALASLPRTTTFSRVANSDLTYLVTKIQTLIPVLGEGSTDQWGLRDRIDVLITQRTTVEQEVIQWFRNGVQVATADNIGDGNTSISGGLVSAWAMFVTMDSIATAAKIPEAVDKSLGSWDAELFQRLDEFPDLTIFKGNGACSACKASRVILIGGISALGALASKELVTSLGTTGAVILGGFIAGVAKEAVGGAISCGKQCAVGQCRQDQYDCPGGFFNADCVAAYEKCCKMAKENFQNIVLEYDSQGNFMGCS